MCFARILHTFLDHRAGFWGIDAIKCSSTIYRLVCSHDFKSPVLTWAVGLNMVATIAGCAPHWTADAWFFSLLSSLDGLLSMSISTRWPRKVKSTRSRHLPLHPIVGRWLLRFGQRTEESVLESSIPFTQVFVKPAVVTKGSSEPRSVRVCCSTIFPAAADFGLSWAFRCICICEKLVVVEKGCDV